MSEIELLNKIKDKPSAFSTIFELYYNAIFGYIFRRIGNFNDASDVAADTFYKAFKNITYYDYRGISIKIWLYRIATNEVNQFFRNQKKHSSIFKNLTPEESDRYNHYLQEDRAELEAELQKHNEYIQVMEQLKTLSIKYQEVITLKYFEGKDNKEIALILNKNEGTVKSLLSRGVEKLRIKYNQL